jgi:hypothetical protein
MFADISVSLSYPRTIHYVTATVTQLTREIEVLKNFPAQLRAGKETLALAAFPHLVLMLEITPRSDAPWGVSYDYDIVCELALKRATGALLKINVHVSTSRQWPAGVAVVIEGAAQAAGLDLDALDSAVCALAPHEQVWQRHGTAMRGLIQRWVSEYSLRSIAHLSDFQVASNLRTQSRDFYNEILKYVSAIDVGNPEIIRTFLRTALVSPDEVRDAMRNNPTPARTNLHDVHELMNSTMELHPNQKLKNAQSLADLGLGGEPPSALPA